MRVGLVGALLFLVISSSAEARVACNNRGCSDWGPSWRHIAGKRVVYQRRVYRKRRYRRRREVSSRRYVYSRGFPAPLVRKVREIKRRCGSRVTSGYRRGARVRGYGTVSNHALRRAYDVSGNPRCIYRVLRGWPGGYSTDYWSAPGGPHVHISYNRRKEWGARFRHRHGRRYARRRRR